MEGGLTSLVRHEDPVKSNGLVTRSYYVVIRVVNFLGLSVGLFEKAK